MPAGDDPHPCGQPAENPPLGDLSASVRRALAARLDPQTMAMWIEPLSFRGWTQEGIVVAAPSDFVATWVQNHYRDLLADAVAEVTGRRGPIRLCVDPALAADVEPAPSPPPPPAPTRTVPATAGAGLCPRYRFDTFVCGASNELAYSAARAVAADPGTRFNPVFFYGDAGLGKTHLLHAIAHELTAQDPSRTVVLASAEAFTNEFVQAARTNDYEAYRARYRDACDVLLLDDIQFIAGRARTMGEFFHAFNALHEAGKQIVVTADRLPGELPGMEERLISRLSWGLVADIQPPDPTLRRALVRRKAEEDGLSLDDAVVEILAAPSFRNVRELEGLVTRTVALANLRGVTVDASLVRQSVAELGVARSQTRHVTVDEVQRTVARHFGLKLSELKGPRRHKALARARMIAIYLARELTGESYPALGAAFGGRDHTTMLHAVRRIEDLVAHDPTVADTVLVLRRRFERSGG